MKITEIKTSNQLHEIYTEDEPARVVDFVNEQYIKRFACNKILIINRNNELIATQRWFITRNNNELIYDIKNNDWVNLDMFDKGTSYCKSIVLIEGE
ncbi:MAG: hypothetical protein LKF43_00265 [Streptococcaceae bacterium]|jgi:hypothetical protein|nr:hypothetical protein [Streptococcaceae bacterium]